MKRTIVAALSASIVLAGCATASKDITPTYTSPMQYQSYDCDQLASESQRIQTRVVQLGGRLDTAASNDKAIAGVGMILFWPALFALGGTKQQESDYGRLRGEYDAVQQSAILRKCPGIVAASTTASASSTDRKE
jgi:outer membrane murein-binding lipoprotein Lpp